MKRERQCIPSEHRAVRTDSFLARLRSPERLWGCARNCKSRLVPRVPTQHATVRSMPPSRCPGWEEVLPSTTVPAACTCKRRRLDEPGDLPAALRDDRRGGRGLFTASNLRDQRFVARCARDARTLRPAERVQRRMTDGSDRRHLLQPSLCVVRPRLTAAGTVRPYPIGDAAAPSVSFPPTAPSRRSSRSHPPLLCPRG
jgi:hypothetical protein